MRSKQGQGLSLNTVIIAALALIVLVVLILIFTGRISIFQKGVDKEANAELIKMRIVYGDCRPTAVQEESFRSSFVAAETIESKEQAKSSFKQQIDSCKVSSNKASCESSGCAWS